LSLRARLLAGLVALASVGLGVAAVLIYEEQRSFLFDRLDQQLITSYLPSVSLVLDAPAVPRQAFVPKHPKFPPPQLKPSGVAPIAISPPGTFAELLDANGRVLRTQSFVEDRHGPSPPALPAGLRASPLSRPRLFTVSSKAGSSLRYRVAVMPAPTRGEAIAVAVPLRDVDQTLHRLVLVEALVGSGVILALVLAGWVVIRVGLRPLERMGRVAREIAGGDLSRRVSPENPRTEVGRLGLSMNEMLMQIERAFADRQESEERLRRFHADASHELRTPLASIRGYAELFRLGLARDPVALARAMARIEAEAARMGVLVENMLLLARLDELPETERTLVDLRELATHAAADARAIAPARAVRVDADGPVEVIADPNQLRQVLANLVRNAVIHTPPASPIELAVHPDEDDAVLEVRDHGPGLPAEAERIFDRFWRAGGGRARGPGGAGLGLAIVRAIVHAHHGDVHAKNAGDGGAVFRVRLPLAR
jgi:two-component system OmpR family sensor kinase